MFERYGDIGDVHIPRDRHTRQSRGFGFVRFVSRKDADYAISKMDGRYVDGREIRVSFAKYDRPIDEGGHRGRDRDRDDRRRYVAWVDEVFPPETLYPDFEIPLTTFWKPTVGCRSLLPVSTEWRTGNWDPV